MKVVAAETKLTKYPFFFLLVRTVYIQDGSISALLNSHSEYIDAAGVKQKTKRKNKKTKQNKAKHPPPKSSGINTMIIILKECLFDLIREFNSSREPGLLSRNPLKHPNIYKRQAIPNINSFLFIQHHLNTESIFFELVEVHSHTGNAAPLK